jgi:hypothetical protein
MSPRDGTGPVMLTMSFASRLAGEALPAGCSRLVDRLRATPGVLFASATSEAATGEVTVACLFAGLLARERFVLSSLYDRLPVVAGMIPGSRRVRRLDLGATDRDDLAGLATAASG